MDQPSQKKSQLQKGMSRVGVEDMPLQKQNSQVSGTRRNSQASSMKNLAFYNNTTQRRKNNHNETEQDQQNDIGVAAQLNYQQQDQIISKNHGSVTTKNQNKIDHRDRQHRDKQKLFRETQVRQSYQSLDHSSTIQALDQNNNKKLFTHRKSQLVDQQEYTQISDNNRDGRKTGRQFENKKQKQIEQPSIMSDDQGTMVIMGTINTDVFSESKRQNRVRQSYKESDFRNKQTISQNQIDMSNINNKTKVHDQKQSIRSSKSQHVIHINQRPSILKQVQQDAITNNQKQQQTRKTTDRNYESYKVSSIEDDESHQKEERLFSPQLKSTMNIKNAKSEMKRNTGYNSNKNEYDIPNNLEESPQVAQGSHRRKISNFNLKKVPLTELQSPIGFKPMSARPKGFIHGDLKISKQFPKQDSDHERSGDKTKRAKRSQTRKADSRYDLQETQNHNNSKKIFSMIVQDRVIQNNANQDSKYRSPLGPKLGRRMGDRFGQMFKLQKKNLNDEGIAGIDEANLNNSYEQNHFGQKNLDDEDDTPFDSQSERNSTDALQVEYQMVKQKLDKIKLQGYNSRMSQSHNRGSSAKQMREKSERGRKSNIKSKKSNTKSKYQQYDSHSEKNYDKKELMSYDDNSFERELIQKLEQSSIHEDLNKSKRRGKSLYPNSQYKNNNNKSKSNIQNHKRQKSNKIKQLTQSSDDQHSCSTCNMRQNSSDNSSNQHNNSKQKKKSSKNQRQKSVGGNNQKRQKSKRNMNQQSQQQQFINQFPMQMPLMTMLTPQFSMFGFPMPQVPTTQIMNFQNNFSYQGSQVPMFMPPQQQFMNMSQQPFVPFFPNDQSQQQVSTPKNTSNEKKKEQKLKKDKSSLNNVSDNLGHSQLNINSHSISMNLQQQQQSVNQFQDQQINSPVNNLDVLGLGQNLQYQQQLDTSQIRASHNKNTLSNQTTDSFDNQQKFDKSLLPLQKQQKSAQVEENQQKLTNQQRLGSPQSNLSRLDAQSTNMTGDYQSSVAPSQLAIINFNNRRSLNIQTQIKEVNQLYLNQLKDKFTKPSTTINSQQLTAEIDNFNHTSKDQVVSPTNFISRNSMGLNQAKSNPPQNTQQNKNGDQQKSNYQIQPNLQYQNDMQQNTYKNLKNINNEQQQRQLSQPPQQIKPINMKNYESQNAKYPNQKDQLTAQKLDRHRSPQPSEMRMFTNGNTNERLNSHRYTETENNPNQQDYNDNYYFNNNSGNVSQIQKRPSNNNEQIQTGGNDIQSKLKMLNAKLSQVRQDTNNSRQIKDIKFVELLSNNDDNEDQSAYEGYDEQSNNNLQKKSRQDTHSQPPDFNRVSYQPKKQLETQRHQQNNSINSSIIQKRSIQISQSNQVKTSRRKNSTDQNFLEDNNQIQNSKHGLIVIDNSPKSNNTSQFPKNNNKQQLASPKSHLDTNNKFAFKSEYTGGESIRSSIFLMEEESKSFANNQSIKQTPSKFSQQRTTLKQQPKKRPSNTTKQSGLIEDFHTGVRQSILNSTTNNNNFGACEETNQFHNNSLSTHRLINNSKFEISTSNRDQTKGSNTGKHSLISKQVTLNNTSRLEPEKEVFVEIYDKSQRQQPKNHNDIRGKSQINSQQIDTVSDTSASNLSLADMFKQKMRQKSIPPQLEKRLNQQHQVQSQQMSVIQEKEVPKQDTKADKERTKQELLELRKKMMKSKVKEKKDNFAVEPQRDANGKIKEVPMELMQRLSKGQKVQVDQKEAIKLSHKNYENLPEIKKKKEEERKKEDYKQRQLQVKKYAEELDKKRKQLHVKKQASNNEKQNDII